MSLPKKIAVVTGATGFVGSHLADRLLAEGYEVRCIVRRNSNLQWLANKPVQLYDTGLTRPADLADVLRNADYVYHVAGTVKSLKREGYYVGNVETTQTLFDAIEQYSPHVSRVVVVSSLSVTGPARGDMPLDEQSPYCPLTEYGRSKVAQELLCAQYAQRLPISIVRPPAIYGERDVDVFLFFRSCYQGFIASTWHDQTFSLVYVGDVVAGMIGAATSPNAVGQTYFISSERGYQWGEIADIVARHRGKRAIICRIPDWGIRGVSALAELWGHLRKSPMILSRDKANEMIQQSWVCSSGKAERDFGYRAQMPPQKGIVQTLQWYEQNGWL
jgi:dihydroflavonol-4-reductase